VTTWSARLRPRLAGPKLQTQRSRSYLASAKTRSSLVLVISCFANPKVWKFAWCDVWSVRVDPDPEGHSPWIRAIAQSR
jgi:hypothetical protein